MLFVSVVIVYSLILAAIELFIDLQLGLQFVEKELLQDFFGSILTVLILLDFKVAIMGNRLGLGGLALTFGVLYWLIGGQQQVVSAAPKPHA